MSEISGFKKKNFEELRGALRQLSLDSLQALPKAKTEKEKEACKALANYFSGINDFVGHLTGNPRTVVQLPKELADKFKPIPVVSLEEHKAKVKKLKGEIQFKDYLSNLIVERDKGLWQKSVSLEWLEKECKKKIKSTKVLCPGSQWHKGKIFGWGILLSAARKEAEAKKEVMTKCKNCGKKIKQIQKGIWVHLKYKDACDCGKPEPLEAKKQ